MKIWIVDAFSNGPFTGNPAAVMIVDDFFSNNLCQKIAAEMNLSETAFVKPVNDQHFHIRWFTPKVEVKLCGHATLASCHILRQEGYFKVPELTLDSLSGPLKVVNAEPELTLNFPLQKTGDDFKISDPIANQLPIIVNACKALDNLILSSYRLKAQLMTSAQVW